MTLMIIIYLNQMRVHQDGLWVHPDVFCGCTQMVRGCLPWVHPDRLWMSSMGAPRSSVDVFRGCTQMVRGYFQSVRNDRVSSYPELERKNKNEIQQPVLCVKLPFPPWVQNKPPRKGPGTRFYFSTPRQGPPYGQKKPDFSARAARGPSVTIWVHPWTSRWVRPAQHFLGAPRFLGAGGCTHRVWVPLPNLNPYRVVIPLVPDYPYGVPIYVCLKWRLVMSRARLGLEAPAWARLDAAWASKSQAQARSPKQGLQA
ncbi:hypothetical protein C8R43DRAFT_940987 [Mycena crocata]|nr:hypothetical protein C8R43DRAFT_940987 [Mycena crocata]